MKKVKIHRKTHNGLNYYINILTIGFFIQFIISCSSTSPLTEIKPEQEKKLENNLTLPIDIQKITSLEQIKQLTFEGVNNQVSIAPSGLKIIYISQKKIKHEHTQIYEMELKSNLEKRITYQDGYLAHPLFLNENDIAYASTTDAIKENPLNYKKEDPNLFEVYISDRFGNEITRLTKRLGNDSQLAHTQHLNKFIYHVLKKDNKSWIQRIDHSTNESVIYLQSENDLLTNPNFASNGLQFSWLSQNLLNLKFTLQFGSLTSNHLVIKKSITYFELPLKTINSLNWADDLKGIWLTGSSALSDYSHLYYFSVADNCLKQLTSESIDIREFQDIPFSNQLVIFTMGNDKNSQIFTAQRPDVSLIKCLENQKSSL